jgi:hypothetical protein
VQDRENDDASGFDEVEDEIRECRHDRSSYLSV